MNWIKHFELFLFDMDGLLVNTEELHYLAYQRMCLQRGVKLDWSFPRYCEAAHYDSTALRDQIYASFPKLHEQEPRWDILYTEKKQAVVDLINEGVVHPMPGAERLLKALDSAGIKRCVVTHSPDELVQAVRKQNPILNTIPNWITRHDYTHPKPNPESYLKAIQKLAAPEDRIIGFEDTPRGLRALLGTPATSVLISTIDYPEIPSFIEQGALHFCSLEAIPEDWCHN